MNGSTPGLPVHHQLLEFTQTHIHWVSDAIQPSHLLLSPSPPAPQSLPASESFPMSQLFAWGGQSIGVSALASVLPVNTQNWSPLGWTSWISWRRQWYPTPVLLPGESHGWRSLEGCSPWGRWVGHNWATSLSLFTFMHWRRQWQPTPVFLPGEFQGWGSLVGCRLWGHTESDTTEAT